MTILHEIPNTFGHKAQSDHETYAETGLYIITHCMMRDQTLVNKMRDQALVNIFR